MLLSFHGLSYMLLILVGLVPYSIGADTGCNDWTISGEGVCCKECKPGNRIVKLCGDNPALLCTLCEPDTFTTNPKSFSCLKCKQCIGVQITLKPCTSTNNTVCGCKDRYRCGNEECAYCVKECQEGEEPTELRSCKKCPEGTFNDKIHSKCKKWKESCPNGQFLDNKGNALRDHECISVKPPQTTESNFLPVGTKQNKDQIKWIPVSIAGGVALFAVFCIIVSVIACVKAQSRTEKPKPDTSDQELSEEHRIMVVEQEACSFHHPEQEQGGSSESISTQDSETKLIV